MEVEGAEATKVEVEAELEVEKEVEIEAELDVEMKDGLATSDYRKRTLP